MITVVVATRNRHELLLELVNCVSASSEFVDNLIIVDSSDIFIEVGPFTNIGKIQHIQTDIKSAAIQRNIGLDAVPELTEFLFVLDDDVRPDRNYFSQLKKILLNHNLVGVSGLAVSPGKKKIRELPNGFRGVVYRFFKLDSKKDGLLLYSGVNIPVRSFSPKPVYVDWLIACSAWRFRSIEETRYEKDFPGASLGEDVIFSLRMKEKGDLAVCTDILLEHLESDISRSSAFTFWESWVKNRLRIIQVAKFGKLGVLAFWWSNFGQLLSLTWQCIKDRNTSFENVKGLLQGCYEILRVKN